MPGSQPPGWCAAQRVNASLYASHLGRGRRVALEVLDEGARDFEGLVEPAGVEKRAEGAAGRPYGYLGEPTCGGIPDAGGEFG